MFKTPIKGELTVVISEKNIKDEYFFRLCDHKRYL